MAVSLMEVCDVLLGTPGSRWVSSSLKNRELKLNYFGKLIENNIHGQNEFLQAIEVLAPRFSFVVLSFLETRMQEDRLSAFTGIFFLQMLL